MFSNNPLFIVQTAKAQEAIPSFLVELGNGEKIIFDMETGSDECLAELQIPYDYLNKVFLRHLLADHSSDLPALWAEGTINNRTVPLEIRGPTGSAPEYCTKYAIKESKHFFK